ncbi:hypothetical protein [Paenibacillus sp. y28]|uniref:hypothetical protein n=1 Tax=Paenibacillus sp. y28 TaxID=3129110 RepID=UPI0030171C9C
MKRKVETAAAAVNTSGAGNPAGSEAAYSKQQLLQSKLFPQGHKDVMNALLADEQAYTINEVKSSIEQFLKKAVL